MSELARKLSEEELFQCFKSLNVPVRLSEIKTPTRYFIINVIEYFLKDLQIDIRSVDLKPFEAIQHLEHPEVSEETRTMALLMRSINLFICMDGVVLYLKDITDPKPKRTKKILNYLIVFWNYALRKYALYDSIAEGFQKEREKIDEINQENESVSEKQNDLIETLKKLEPAREELKHRVSSNNERLQEFVKQKEADEAAYQELKKKEQDFRTEIATTDFNTISAKETIDDLDQCIVTSPEQYIDEIKKLKDLIKQEEFKMKEKETEYKEKVKQFEASKVYQKDITKTEDWLQKVEESFSKLSTTANQAGVNTQKINEQVKEIEKVEKELQRKSQRKQIHDEKSVQIQLKSKKDIDTFAAALQMIEKDVVQEQEQLQSYDIPTSKLQQKIVKTVDDIVQILEHCKQAEVETEKAHVEYSDQMRSLSKYFREDCEEVKEHVKRFFGC